MNLKLVSSVLITLCSIWGISAQCLSGGCEVGISRSQVDNGVFIGNYDNGEKSGLGITYIYNPQGSSTSFAEYIENTKTGVEYTQDVQSSTKETVHTFQSYYKGAAIYPAFRITKENKKIKIQVAFNDEDGWNKYDGDQVVGELQVLSVIHDGSPAFIALNGKDQVMAISTTVEMVSLLSSEITEKYYNGLQLDSKDNRLTINIFPKAGANETIFRTNLDWNMQDPGDGLWLYKRYFNDQLSYKATYDDVLALPSQKEIKERKLQKAFDFIADQVEEYDFEKGYPGKAKDFIDMLKDIKERAERKGLNISNTYDITMIKLYLQQGDKDKTLQYAQTACIKSTNSYNLISELINTKFQDHAELLPLIKKNEGLAISGN